eukprot:341534-Alexandrium_andersonii.AAC.1
MSGRSADTHDQMMRGASLAHVPARLQSGEAREQRDLRRGRRASLRDFSWQAGKLRLGQPAHVRRTALLCRPPCSALARRARR